MPEIKIVGRKKTNFDRCRIELIASPEFVRSAALAAKQLGVSLSALVRLAVGEKIERMRKGK